MVLLRGAPLLLPKATIFHLYKDLPIVYDGLKHPLVGLKKQPLVMFSHGAGGNASGYVWFGEYLASHQIVAGPSQGGFPSLWIGGANVNPECPSGRIASH
jgi:hypothetical protein